MIPFGPNLRAIITINLSLLYAVVLAGLSWLCWPESAEDWRFGLFSILCGLTAFALTVAGIGNIKQHVMRDIPAHRFLRQGRKPQSDKTLGDDDLRKAGVIDR